MPKLSYVLGKNVLSKADCRILGFIQNAYFDVYCKKIVYFVYADEFGIPFALPFSAILSVSDVAIVNDNVEKLDLRDLDITSFLSDFIGKNVYSATGSLKGRINDIIYDLKGKVASLAVDGKEYSPTKLLGIGDVVLLKDDAKPKAKRIVKLPKATENLPVIALSEDNTDNYDREYAKEEKKEEKMAINKHSDLSEAVKAKAYLPAGAPVLLFNAVKELDVQATKPNHTPPRIIADYNFLLGRTLVSDLVSYTGTVLAKANNFVTAEMVELARSHGKLIDLTLNSK